MLPYSEANAITEAVRLLGPRLLRDNVRSNPAIAKNVASVHERAKSLGLPKIPISEESLIDQRKSELIRKLADGSINFAERREYITLCAIRTELMIPAVLRRISKRR